MNNSNFNPNEEIEAMKTTDAAETPVDDTPAADKAVAAETAAEATASEPDVKQETVEETPYTMVTTFSVSASVMRRPFTILLSIPSWAASFVAERPPPCTKTL